MAKKLRTPLAPCVHLGERVQSGCSSPVHQCNFLGKPCRPRGGGCNQYAKWPKCEVKCEGYVPKESSSPASRRHLLYFVCPISGNGVWQWNAEQIMRRIGLFNGKKILAIAQGGRPVREAGKRKKITPLDTVEEVVKRLPGFDQVITVTNNSVVGEVVAWKELWSRVLPGNEGDATFYAHAKGVRRGLEHPTAIKWAEAMYETNLDYWPLVERSLKKYPVVGVFKKLGFCFAGTIGGKSSWHYSGSFFWANNRDIVKRQWQHPPKMWAGCEALPGLIYSPEEAGCVFHEAFGTHMELYNSTYWDMVVRPALEVWRSEHEADRLDASVLSR